MAVSIPPCPYLPTSVARTPSPSYRPGDLRPSQVSPHPSTFGLWSIVFHEYVGIRKAVTAVSRMCDTKVGGGQ